MQPLKINKESNSTNKIILLMQSSWIENVLRHTNEHLGQLSHNFTDIDLYRQQGIEVFKLLFNQWN